MGLTDRVRALELKRQRPTVAAVSEALREYAANGTLPNDIRVAQVVLDLERAQALMLASVPDRPEPGSRWAEPKTIASEK